MTNRIEKVLALLSAKEKRAVKEVIERILRGETLGLQLTKLVGSESIYRVRKGRIRIIFSRAEDGLVRLIAVERRSEKTYRNF